MAVYSMYPIEFGAIRTFQNFLWKDMPGALLPDDPAIAGPAERYSPEELDVFRLSSKSHWDVPIQIGGHQVHFLVSHPTFDTADFNDAGPGNLRADYVLPRRNMKIMAAEVFWPLSTDPLFPLVGTFPFPSSDHRMVWIDVRVK